MSTPTPPPPPPPPSRSTPPPPPPPPPSNPFDISIDMSPTGTVPVYKTEKMNAVPGSASTDDRYGFEIGDDASAPPIAPVGRDADGDGVDDDAQAAEAAQIEAQIAAQSSQDAKKKKYRGGGSGGLRRGRPLWLSLLALFGPLLLLITSFVFIGSALQDPNAAPSTRTSDDGESDEGESDSTSADPQASGDVPPPPIPDVVIGADGDPLARAVQLAENHAIQRSEDSPLPAQIVTVRSDVVGPDTYALRLVVIRYLGSADEPKAELACVDWDVNVATQEVLERGETSLGDEEQGRIDLAVRELELKLACDAATVA